MKVNIPTNALRQMLPNSRSQSVVGAMRNQIERAMNLATPDQDSTLPSRPSFGGNSAARIGAGAAVLTAFLGN